MAANLSRKKATPPQPHKKLLIKLHNGGMFNYLMNNSSAKVEGSTQFGLQDDSKMPSVSSGVAAFLIFLLLVQGVSKMPSVGL